MASTREPARVQMPQNINDDQRHNAPFFVVTDQPNSEQRIHVIFTLVCQPFPELPQANGIIRRCCVIAAAVTPLAVSQPWVPVPSTHGTLATVGGSAAAAVCYRMLTGNPHGIGRSLVAGLSNSVSARRGGGRGRPTAAITTTKIIPRHQD